MAVVVGTRRPPGRDDPPDATTPGSSVTASTGADDTYKPWAGTIRGMDTDAFLADVREANETALSRLGSSKSLYALTGGEMEASAVFDVAADVSHTAATALEAYAADSSSDAAADAFSALGELEAERAVTVGERMDGEAVPDSHEVVGALEDFGDGSGASDVECLGAALGYVLVAKKFAEQATGFFTGEADPQTASEFRSYGSDLESERESLLDALAVVADGSEEEAAAADATSTVVQHAYDHYTERLEDMGVNPKPVC